MNKAAENVVTFFDVICFQLSQRQWGVWVHTNKYTYIWIFKLSSKVHLGNDFILDHYEHQIMTLLSHFWISILLSKKPNIYMTYE